MGPVVTTGDLAGMVLLAIAITVAARKPTHGREAPPGFGFISAMAAPAATAAPAQARWQARSPALVEDRVSGPAPLQLEESVGSRDQ